MKNVQSQQKAYSVLSQKVENGMGIVTLAIDLKALVTGDFSGLSIGMKVVDDQQVPNTYQIVKNGVGKVSNLCGFDGLTMGFYVSQNIEKVSKQAERTEQIAELRAIGWSDEKIMKFLGK